MPRTGNLCYYLLFGLQTVARAQGPPASPFDDVVPSDELEWQPCYDGLFCAKLQAPLNYQVPDQDEAIIPLVKLPAAVDATDDAYKGMVIFSPGGFGFSGVNFTVDSRDMIRSMVGQDSDIVAFDPRGFGFSEPSIVCGPPPPTASTKRSVPRLAERFAEERITASKEAGKDCKAAVGGPTDAGPHSSTAIIARDVMRIVDAYSRTADGKAAPDEGKLLNFLGWSYATYFGQTIASMFPDRIGGMVLDGMLDPYAVQANLTSNSVDDIDGIIAGFFVYCAEAGVDLCPYHTGTRPLDIWKRFSKSFQQLDSKPADIERVEALLVLKIAMSNFAYSPLTLFPQMAEVFLSLEEALESDTLLAWTEEVSVAVGASAFADAVSVPTMAVVCPEQRNRWFEENLAGFQPLIDESKDQSIVGELYVNTVVLGCAGWSIDAVEVFEGPFGGETRNPILFVSNAYDIPCPKVNSFLAASRFSNSKAFLIDGIGHVSFATNNKCATATIRQYFQEGEMPEEDGCPLEIGPFGVMLNGTMAENLEDAGLTDLVALLEEEEGKMGLVVEVGV